MAIKICLLLLLTNSTFARINCNEAIKQGDYDQALMICKEDLKKGIGQDIEVWINMVDIYHVLGNDQQEAYYLAKIKSHPGFIENMEFQYKWHRRAGQKFYFEGDFKQAHQYLLNGLLIAENEKQPSWLSKSLNDVGLTALKLKDYASSLTHFKRSLTYKLEYADSYQIGNTYNNIALVHMDLEEHQLAIEYYEQALNQYVSYTQMSDIDERVYQQISHLYEDLTKAYSLNGNVTKAKKYANKIADTFKAKMSPRSQARALMNLGQHNLSIKKYTLAQFFYDEANAIHMEYGYEFDAGYYLDVAQVYFQNSQLEPAIDAVTKGLDIAQKTNDPKKESEFHQLLSEHYQLIDIAKAYEHLKLHQQSREQFLQDKYGADLNNIKHQIEKQKIQHDLVNEQLINANKSTELQKLTNLILIAVIVLLVLVTFLVFYLINKKKERRELIQSIKHHEQQLFVMQNQQINFRDETSSINVDSLKSKFKVSLVSTLIDALSIWEKNTGSDRIELAEQSKAWTISIDNGTLRTRSLDKYLDIEKIPENPRWRNVVKTCHFVLTRNDLEQHDRHIMEQKLAALLEQIKQLSLVSNKT